MAASFTILRKIVGYIEHGDKLVNAGDRVLRVRCST